MKSRRFQWGHCSRIGVAGRLRACGDGWLQGLQSFGPAFPGFCLASRCTLQLPPTGRNGFSTGSNQPATNRATPHDLTRPDQFLLRSKVPTCCHQGAPALGLSVTPPPVSPPPGTCGSSLCVGGELRSGGVASTDAGASTRLPKPPRERAPPFSFSSLCLLLARRVGVGVRSRGGGGRLGRPLCGVGGPPPPSKRQGGCGGRCPFCPVKRRLQNPHLFSLPSPAGLPVEIERRPSPPSLREAFCNLSLSSRLRQPRPFGTLTLRGPRRPAVIRLGASGRPCCPASLPASSCLREVQFAFMPLVPSFVPSPPRAGARPWLAPPRAFAEAPDRSGRGRKAEGARAHLGATGAGALFSRARARRSRNLGVQPVRAGALLLASPWPWGVP